MVLHGPASLKSPRLPNSVSMSGKNRRFDMDGVSGCAVEASHSPQEQVNPALAAARGAGELRAGSSAALLAGAGRAGLQEASVGAARSGSVFALKHGFFSM